MSNYDKVSEIINQSIKDNDVKFVMAVSPIQESNHVTLKRIKDSNNGLFFIDHISLIKKDLEDNK